VEDMQKEGKSTKTSQITTETGGNVKERRGKGEG